MVKILKEKQTTGMKSYEVTTKGNDGCSLHSWILRQDFTIYSRLSLD